MLGGMAHGRTDGPERKEKPTNRPTVESAGYGQREREAQLAGGEQKGQVVRVFSQTRFGASEEGEDGIKHEIGCQRVDQGIPGREVPSEYLK